MRKSSLTDSNSVLARIAPSSQNYLCQTILRLLLASCLFLLAALSHRLGAHRVSPRLYPRRVDHKVVDASRGILPTSKEKHNHDSLPMVQLWLRSLWEALPTNFKSPAANSILAWCAKISPNSRTLHAPLGPERPAMPSARAHRWLGTFTLGDGRQRSRARQRLLLRTPDATQGFTAEQIGAVATRLASL